METEGVSMENKKSKEKGLVFRHVVEEKDNENTVKRSQVVELKTSATKKSVFACAFIAILFGVGGFCIGRYTAPKNQSQPNTDIEYIAENETESQEQEHAEEIYMSESSGMTATDDGERPNGEAKSEQQGTIQTDSGEFMFSAVNASEVTWEDDFDHIDGYRLVSINCIVENTSYDDDIWGGIFAPIYMAVVDSDGFSLEHCDVMGPNNGGYQLNYTVPVGEKAKVGFPYYVPDGCDIVKVRIDDQYEIDLEILQ